MVGGSKPSKRFLQTLFTHFDSVTVFYGSTEMGHAAETRCELPDTFDGGLSPITDMVRIEVVDEAGQQLPDRTEGHVRIRRVLDCPIYINDRPSTEVGLRNGWFYSGDIGYMDANGRLHISGRSNEVLNLGGSKFSALSVDEIVQGVGGVKDGYCYLRPTETGFHEIEVVFTPSEGHGNVAVARCIVTACRNALPSLLCPKRVFLLPELPRTDTGKALRGRAMEATAALSPLAVSS
jgi:acyl-coenzyme A synthetase/AMP-(fatty) acid ligase